MQVQVLHPWALSPAEARLVQESLRHRVLTDCDVRSVRTVAGVDISTAAGRAHAAVVTLSFPELQLLEVAEADLPISFPYVPGLLAFREGPAIVSALLGLVIEPDLLIFDGHGLAHPRRMGIATHMGVVLDRPSIGCAKSLLCGHHGDVGPDVGDQCEICDRGEVIGVALRTREGVRPIYVSIGHKMDLAMAVVYVQKCTSGYRLPEPVRWAHKVAGGIRVPGSNGNFGA